MIRNPPRPSSPRGGRARAHGETRNPAAAAISPIRTEAFINYYMQDLAADPVLSRGAVG
jgi:hypothetical protein